MAIRSVRWLPVAAAVLIPILLSACNSAREMPVYAVRGQLLIQKQPAANALVIFTPVQDAQPEKWPKGFPRGKVGEDGAFQLTTYRDDDGAPAGEYAVTVLWLVKNKDDEESEFDRLQGRYADPAASKIRIEVKADRKGNKIEPIHLN